MIRRPPRSTPLYSSAASDVYKRQKLCFPEVFSLPQLWFLCLMHYRSKPLQIKGFHIDLLLFQVQNLSLIHISEPTRRTPISYAVFCLKKKKKKTTHKKKKKKR